MNNAPNQKQKLIVWWVLWASFLFGVVQIYMFIGAKTAATSTKPSLGITLLGLIPFFISGVIRWIILPRQRSNIIAFPIYILGIAFAESCTFLGIFLFPAYKQEFFVVSLLGILQFIPVFAGRYFQDDKNI